MIRQMIRIDDEKCNGCGVCTEACHEGALELVNGKARLIRDDYCDGLGNCLPVCPTGAISFETREALPFDEEALKKNTDVPMASLCKGSGPKVIDRREDGTSKGELSQWPIQLKLVPLRSSFYDRADLLIAADCTAFANSDFHRKFIKGRITVIGCPKFDSGDYVERLSEIFANNISSVTVARMEVPCCRELERMVKAAFAKSQKKIPYRVVVISTDGTIAE